MTAGLLRRLRRMDRAELVYRARVAARAEAGRLASAWRPPRWRRAALAGQLRAVSLETRAAIDRLREHDSAGAHEALLAHFAARPKAVPVTPEAFPRMAGEVARRFPEAAPEARARGERLLEGRFELLGYTDLRFCDEGGDARAIDWHMDPVHGRRAPRDWWSRVRFLDPSHGDHKIIWELNRHQHWLALARAGWLTGEPRYRDEFIRQLRHWLDENPPLLGINWSSMLELSLRCITWLWCLQAFAVAPCRPRLPEAEGPDPSANEPPWTLDLLLGIREQMCHVERNLSTYFSPNTHLTGEALGLYVCGLGLPELDAAAGWAAAGRKVLLEQIGRQVLPDGGHCERSTHYHRYTLDFYLVALAFARATGDPCQHALADAVRRLAEAALLLADQSGRLPAIGDDDGGSLFPICRRFPGDVRDSLATAAVLLGRHDLALGPAPEEPLWLVGETVEGRRARQSEPRASHASGALPDTGYYVSRAAPGTHVVIDGGPHGFLNGGHAHADALSLTMAFDGRPLLIDPGTGSYTVSASWRDRLRSTAAHNTLALGSRSQSVPSGPFHWRTVAETRVERWHNGEGFDYFEGTHDGYRPMVHRRRVVVLEEGLVVVVDSLTGGAGERADVHWHLDPGWTAGVCGDRPERQGASPKETAGRDRGDAALLELRHASAAAHWLVLLGGTVECFRGDEESGLGWYSPVYGRIEPCTTIRCGGGGGLFIAVLGKATGGRPPVVSLLARATGDGVPDDAHDSVGLRLAAEGGERLLFFVNRRPGAGMPAFDMGGERIETDARFLLARRGASGEIAPLAVLDGGRTLRPVVAGPES